MDNNIKNTVLNYLCLKKECMDRGFEDKLDVFDLFYSEIHELTDIVHDINGLVSTGLQKNITKNQNIVNAINFYEELLLNELADVLLTASRLIQEFELEEPFAEMLEYKYERQVYREVKRYKIVKNELLK